MGNDGTVILTPHFTRHDYATDYEGNDALVSSAVEINKSYLFAIHLLRLAGHKVTLLGQCCDSDLLQCIGHMV